MPKMFISNGELQNVLSKATIEERFTITKLLDSNQIEAYSPVKLQEKVCEEGGDAILNFKRGQGTGYLDIVDDVAEKLEIKELPSYFLTVSNYDEVDSLKYSKEDSLELGINYAEEIEEKIVIDLLEKAYESIPEEKKSEFDKQLNITAKKFNLDTTTHLTVATGGLVILGNLGGFATYTFLTTALSTISIGTLGFGVYTAATTFVSFLLGPPGWAALGASLLYTIIGRPDYSKLVTIVATIGVIRQRIKYEENKST